MSSKTNEIASRTKHSAPSDRLLQTADDLIEYQGNRAVGVDHIVRTTGVAKISMYQGFPSKDALIVDYLRVGDATF